ncbi:MFS transporter, OFA family, oxalate/formate antiporter [Sporobacter termitidis DSM 10068]|uniref:MFS transporter, OFA family, oxalate/formate antiporter n=1 Tax=Sporobacter termitidis DSM 10068 TaxID=1123282 RepID=A0A1M5YGZ6_9FIRM|nr:OFA family MFS transporter [Sporobacter termitidis]SHI11128.1 MFS transporter, OFA family, oxalate/formate antiporter [Sporobacter termitidis DSM 10068]
MKSKRSATVPIIGCIIIQICVGILYMWSVFKTPIIASFDWSKEAATMVSSYMLFAFVAGNLIGGFINDKKGPRLTSVLGITMFCLGVFLTAFLTKETINLMYLTYCVLGGLGSGFAYGAGISCLQKWLPHRKGLASGIAVSAFAFSTVIFTPVSNALMDAHKVDGIVSFQPVFITLAVVFFVAGIIGTFLVRLPDEEYLRQLPAAPASAKVYTGKNCTLGQAMKTVPFWCIFLEILFINGTWTLSVPLIVDQGMRHGLTEAAAVLTLTITGVFNAGGRLIMATVSDKLGRTNTIIVLSVLTLIGAGLMIVGVPGFGFAVAICIIAFGYGGPASTNAAFTTDFFGPKNSGTNYGVAMLALGISSILFNTISAQFLKGDFTKTYIMAAITAIIPVILMLIIKNQLKKMKAEA